MGVCGEVEGVFEFCGVLEQKLRFRKACVDVALRMP